MIQILIMRLTGGRPMTRLMPIFPDLVTGRQVYMFRDYFGRLWMAEHRWSLVRVAPLHGLEPWE